MSKIAQYSDSEFILAVKNARSISQVLKTLGLTPAGGNYKTVNKKVEELKLDTSHWKGQNWAKGKKFPDRPKKSLDELLTKNSSYQSNKLRLRLLREGIFEHKCYRCERKTWNNEEIPLDLEHINGDNRDHRLENLTLLCPNCHAQTPTYKGRNKKSIQCGFESRQSH